MAHISSNVGVALPVLLMFVNIALFGVVFFLLLFFF